MARYIDADKLRERDFGDFGYEMRYEIDRTPTEDVRPVVRGKWERGFSFPDGEYVKCTVCGEIIKCTYPMHFCPNCGADMREVEK